MDLTALQVWRTPWRDGFLAIARDCRRPREEPSLLDVPFRLEDWAPVRDALVELADRPGTRYLAAGHEVLRAERWLDDRVSLHWLHRPQSWAEIPTEALDAVWPQDPQHLETVRTPEYADLSPRFGPRRIEGAVPCPCEVLAIPAESLERPRPFGAELTPQAVWDPAAEPFDAGSLVSWAGAGRVELYRCAACGERWAAVQIDDGLALRYESRRLTAAAFDRFLSLARG